MEAAGVQQPGKKVDNSKLWKAKSEDTGCEAGDSP